MVITHSQINLVKYKYPTNYNYIDCFKMKYFTKKIK